MLVDLILYNTKVYTQKGLIEAGIAINKDRIVKIAKKTNLPKATTRIDLKGNLALPGLIDSHVHLRDEQLSYKEDFTSGTSAAAAGGITTVVDMPNNQPTTMSHQSLKERMKLAENHILVNVAFNSAFPSRLNQIQKIASTGAIGFKLYLLQQIGGINIDNDNNLLKAFQQISKTKTPIAVHAEDRKTVEKAQNKLMIQKRNDLEAFLEAHPAEAEENATRRAIELAIRSGAHLHLCHISSRLAMIAALHAKTHGYDVTCEVTPHHLLLTSKHLSKCGKVAMEIPPLRNQSDVTYLWRQLKKGLIDTIASDHAPHSWQEKNLQSIWEVKTGIVGLETMLPLLLTQLNKGNLTLGQLVRLTCENPAKIYHIKERGTLAEDSPADITIVNPKKPYRINASRFQSKAKFSPFDGWKVKGKAMKTFVNGQLVMDEGEVQALRRVGRVIRG